MHTDVLIVGASIAGCTAALAFAAQGLQVTVIEKKNAPDHYKRLCTHFIQPSALPILKQLGIAAAIEKIGGLRNKADIWTSAGWIRSDQPYSEDVNTSHGYNIERKLLDPLLRRMISNTPAVKYIAGLQAYDAEFSGSNVTGIWCRNAAGDSQLIKAKLIVAADGRFSDMAPIVGNEEERSPNNRIACFAYFKNMPLSSGNHSQFWMVNPHMAFAYPLQNDTTLLCLFIKKDIWDDWKDDLETFFTAFVNELPDGPSIDTAERITTFYKMTDMDNIKRHPVKNGVAFIGDAALALDPMSGVGCGFAFQSAGWLVDHTAQALLQKTDLSASLQEYAAFHSNQLGSHNAGIIAESFAEPEDGQKEKLYEEVVNDPELINAFLALTGRLITPQQFQNLYLRKVLLKRSHTSPKNIKL